jgi:hypothetical protein
VLENLAGKAKGLNVTPIVVESYAKIPEMLSQIYTSDLSAEICLDYQLTGPDEYWQRLLLGKRR